MWRDVVPLWLVLVLVTRDVLLACLMPFLARRGYGPLPVHFAGKAATFALLYAFPLLLLAELARRRRHDGGGARLGVRRLGGRPVLVRRRGLPRADPGPARPDRVAV